MQKTLIGLGAILAMVTLAGCQTAQGFGQDVSTAGQVIQQEAAEVM